MFGMSNFKSSAIKSSVSRSSGLESLVRIAMTNGELAPGVALQINRYRSGKLSCEERRLLAILDDAIADGCITPIEVPVMQSRRQVAYSLG
ncbi:MAG: hypothetical protein HLUCCA11_11885 [Phormidesmis priestleyi Ana]|uniref:Uncharacterized protein n=1 Tax=Phormidesmis priestleyi Ana TaxID=1666911 RepID=A0A0P7ZK55_9CYAN|nr:MAG: hypothetical protein HLUCCA11_11885 [Phormidesmis priestleyi Ana]